MLVDAFFQNLWQDYVSMTPQAQAIQDALEELGNSVLNDHVAFRTFNVPPIAIANLEPLVLNDLGYRRYSDEPYLFEAKKLTAYGYLPPLESQPRIFLSELRVEEMSESSQEIIGRLLQNVTTDHFQDPSIFWHGPLWNLPTHEEYELLANESEYAAWFAALGLRCNHFAVDVNALENHKSIEKMNELVEELGLVVNERGGRTKGSKDVMLEQGSTMASEMPVQFADGLHNTKTCYYEYAKRYADEDGNLYQGFVTASANKIFESTNREKEPELVDKEL